MITLDQYWMGRDKKYAAELTDEMRLDAQKTVDLANALLQEFGHDRGVNSGWRPPSVNAAVGGSKRSNHMTCKAIDLSDDDGELDAWCMANLDVLARLGLWLEHPDSTPRWCHVQTVPPKSGNRIFKP